MDQSIGVKMYKSDDIRKMIFRLRDAQLNPNANVQHQLNMVIKMLLKDEQEDLREDLAEALTDSIYIFFDYCEPYPKEMVHRIWDLEEKIFGDKLNDHSYE